MRTSPLAPLEEWGLDDVRTAAPPSCCGTVACETWRTADEAEQSRKQRVPSLQQRRRMFSAFFIAESSAMAATKDKQETAAVNVGALLDAGDGAMVTLVAGNTRLVVHRAILSDRSPVFAGMFRHDTLEASSGNVTITDVEGPVLRELLGYMYSLQATHQPSVTPELLAAADKYGVSGLKALCEQQLASQLSVENAAATAVLALRYSCASLMEAAVAFIKANQQVLATQGWAEAVHILPKDVVEVSRLLGQPPADTRRLPGEECGMKLIYLAQQGAEEELRALLKAGADVGVRDVDFYNMTALHWAASRGQVQAVRCLVEAGAEVDARDSMQCTPLHSAAYRGRAAVVRLLLASAADPNARNQWRRTPLHDAAERGHADVVAVLLQAGADRRARDDNWSTPLDLARRNNRDQLIEMLT
ncbi:ankyrin-3-like [Schistocerca piceifrons]|uniref:ankyrin-3-like n=1 Tax=Schistocerca piceifrons TaxID=274613 RepID=UPI001F5E63BD|nr:ankyrin-3-like [Schistocerca piceifrons]